MARSPRLAPVTLALALLVLPARALALGFAIDPAASQLSIVAPSQLLLGFPPILTAAPLVPQTPGGGVGGNALPGGGVSDGLTTWITGTIEGDHVPGTSFQFLAGTSIVLGDGGTWLPGPGGAAAPASANLGVHFDAASLGLSGDAAIRNATGSILGSGVTPLVDQGGGVFTFAGTAYSVSAIVDFLSVGVAGSQAIAGIQAMGTATLEELPGQVRLSLPIAMTIVLEDPHFAGALPVEQLDLHLAGQIVAVASVPEAAPALLVLLALLATGLVALRGPVAARPSARGLLLGLLAAWMPLSGCPNTSNSSPKIVADEGAGEHIESDFKAPGDGTASVRHTDPPELGGGTVTVSADLAPFFIQEGSVVSGSSSGALTDVFVRTFGFNNQARAEIGMTSLLFDLSPASTRTAGVEASVDGLQFYDFTSNTGGVAVTVAAEQLRTGPNGPQVGGSDLFTDIVAFCRPAFGSGTSSAVAVPVIDLAGSSTTPIPDVGVLRFDVGPAGATSTALCDIDVSTRSRLTDADPGLWVDSVYLEVIEVASADSIPGSNAPDGSLTAFLDEFTQTTTYLAFAFDPDLDMLSYVWSGPDCGIVTQDPLNPGTLVWEHTHPPCAPGDDHEQVTVEVKIADGTGWEVVCQLQGAGDGNAPCLLSAFPSGP